MRQMPHRRMARWQKLTLAGCASLLLMLLFLLAGVAYQFVNTVTDCAPLAQRAAAEQALFQQAQASPLVGRYPPAPYQPVKLITADGLALQAYFVPSQNGAAVIVLHGYRASYVDMLPVGNLLAQHGYGVLLVDLRGHGGSEGQLVTFGKDEVLDADAAYQYLARQPGSDPRRVGILGNSMGGSTAILYSARNPAIAATAAISPFPSVRDLIAVNTRRALPTPPILLTPFIDLWMQVKLNASLDSFAPARHISELAPRPLLMMVAGEDIMTDPQAELRMYAAAGEPKELWYEPTGEHARLQEQFPEAFEQRVVGFFEKYLK